MNKQILWTTAALLTTTLAVPIASFAQMTKVVESKEQIASTSSTNAKRSLQVVKVGEYKSPVKNRADGKVIAIIQAHQEVGSNRQAATIYIQNLPVLTFLSAKAQTSKTNIKSSQVKVATTETSNVVASKEQSLPDKNNPVWRATRVAAKLNQINLASLDANMIAVNWKSSDRYGIKINGEELVEINTETLLPDTTNDISSDAIQVTNRLRRLLGNAPPLNVIAGLPEAPKPRIIVKPAKQLVAQAVKVGSRGMASWYGPGFNGRRSANGERYNQNGLTAAHRSLPFGTKVRVTNVRNGRSVIVRITDRGPHVRGRIIDLSAAAARIVGVMQSGVAPVQLEILGR